METSTQQIDFTILISPLPKARPRFYARGKFRGTYTPKKTREYEQELALKCLPYKPPVPLTSALKVTLSFAMPIPKSFSKKKRQAITDGTLHHTKTPDADNMAKAVCDSLNGIFFEDDKQIISLSAQKFYNDTPFIRIQILEV